MQQFTRGSNGYFKDEQKIYEENVLKHGYK